jgi:pimeloyl-ACP methyl ester carboxylesterase
MGDNAAMLDTVTGDGIELACETIGEGEPLVMIMGIGAPMVQWPDGFFEMLAGHGLRVTRFDNRDVGRSTWFDHLGTPSMTRPTLQRFAGRTPAAPYGLEEMADDVSALLDGLDIDRAHVVGSSMGGMIAQTFAIRHPDRLRTLTSIMSTTGSRRHSIGRPRTLRKLLQPFPPDREGAIDQTVRLLQAIGSRSYPTPEAETRARVIRCFDQGIHSPGFVRHWAAIMAAGSRKQALASIAAPTLVIHGSEDPLVPVRGGRATARAIPGARFMLLHGMGHDLPRPLWPHITGAIAEMAIGFGPRCPLRFALRPRGESGIGMGSTG